MGRKKGEIARKTHGNSCYVSIPVQAKWEIDRIQKAYGYTWPRDVILHGLMLLQEKEGDLAEEFEALKEGAEV